jgi:predicted amidohydrolase
VVPGGPLRVFDTALGRIGVLICYDAEFPLLGRALIEAGVEILLVPSCTEALSGYSRVRIGAMARALEGQCVVVHSPTVGPAAWSPAVDMNTGAAAVYGPPDLGFPETGVLAQGELNAPGWVTAEIDRASVAAGAPGRFGSQPRPLAGKRQPRPGFRSHRQNSLENRALRAHLPATRARRGATMKE